MPPIDYSVAAEMGSMTYTEESGSQYMTKYWSRFYSKYWVFLIIITIFIYITVILQKNLPQYYAHMFCLTSYYVHVIKYVDYKFKRLFFIFRFSTYASRMVKRSRFCAPKVPDLMHQRISVLTGKRSHVMDDEWHAELNN